MKLSSSSLALLACASLWPLAAPAQSTIDALLNKGWGTNIGWTNWLPSAVDGARIGEYVCSGYVYSANVGWINLGSGFPTNAVQYQNDTGADWGINYFPTSAPGVAILRGYAYGANVGWIAFEGQGNPSVNLLNGQLYGYAYSANCGWINLGSGTGYVVKTDTIAPGIDTDSDGIADAWELVNFGNLTTVNALSDADGDGIPDIQEYLAGTSPLSASSALRITSVAKGNAVTSPVLLNLTFTTMPTRLYRIETSPNLTNPVWIDSGLGNFLPDASKFTTRQVSSTNATQFFRVKALRLGL